MERNSFSPHSKEAAWAVVAVALVLALGIGVYTAAQASGVFDPRGLAADYESGVNDASEGYRTNNSQQDGEAGQHEDNSEDDQKSTEDTAQQANDEQANNDAFSEAGMHTATRVVESGDNSGAATIVVPGVDGEGKAEGGTSPDESGGGSKKDDSGGSGGKDDPSPAPSPTENSYKVLPNDPSPSKGDSMDTSVFPYKAGTGDAEGIEQAGEDEVRVSIEPSYKQYLYYGQKLDAWTIFCSLSTGYFYMPAGTGEAYAYRWDCTQDEFSSYPFFQIVSWTDEDGNLNPELCPEGKLTVTVRYRFAENGTWRETTVTCEPKASRVYFVGQADAGGNATVLGWTEQTSFNLLSLGASSNADMVDLGISLTERALRDQGYVGDDDTITHLLTGWEEGDESLGYTYEVTPGRHVIQVAGYSDELPGGYTVRLQSYFVQFDGESKSSSGTLQTLIDVDESVLTGNGEDELVLTVPDGIEAVDNYKDDKSRGATWSLSSIELPASVLYFNVDGPFAAQRGWKVSADNRVYAATADGVLTSKDGASYLGVPAALAKLDVPSGVTSVQVQQANELSRITVHGTDGAAPTVQTDNLSECLIVVDDDVFESFIETNYAALAAADANGVTVCRASNEGVQYTCSGGMVYSEDDLVRVQNTGSDTVFVQIPTNIAAGAFEGATDVTCVVLFNDEDCTLEKGSLAGGNVQTIVCFAEEQAAGVKRQLAAAGAPNAKVILAQASQEDMLYFVNDGEVTLLSDQGFASAFDGTITAEDGNKLQVNVIAPYAFAGDTELAWVTLGEGVTSIGAYAFQNCGSLQGLFIGATGEVSVGASALEGCGSLGFVASLSSNATFATDEVPNKDCGWYCLPGAEGHDSRFTYIKGYDSLSVGEQADGSLVLYAAENMGDEPTVLVSGGSGYEGTLTLPGSVDEILGGAFAGTGGSWSIDWTSAPKLEWIDASAFAGSGYTGSIVIDSAGGERESLTIARSAFERCAGITSFTADVSEVEVGLGAFAGCGSLGSVSLAGSEPAGIAAGAFSSCGALTSITLGSAEPAKLELYSPGIAFCFTDSAEEDVAIGLNVPEGSEEAYLQSWVYCLVGYTSYDELYEAVEWEIIEATWEWPSEAEVRAKMAEELLEPENRLRTMMGMPTVDASTIIVDESQDVDGFTYASRGEGAYSLTAAPADATSVDLDGNLPEDCTSLTIGSGAFEACENLESVDLGTCVTAIESGAFAGCDGVAVALPSGAADSVSLSGGSTDSPFSFGASIVLSVPADEQANILAAWPMQCLGMTSSSDLDDWLFLLMWDYFEEDSDDWVSAAVAHINDCLLEQENYLRGLMGLEEISSTDEMAYVYEYALDW